MKRTRLMSKLFSDETPQEYKEKIFDKIEEAKENGSSTLAEDGETLQFGELDGDVVIEDQTDGANEVTRAHIDEDDPTNYVLSEVEIKEDPTEEPTEAPTEPATEEPTQEPTQEPTEAPTEEKKFESMEITRPMSDEDEILEEQTIDVYPTEEEDAEKEFSVKFRNFSKSRADRIMKVFSRVIKSADEIVASANVDEDVQVKFEEGTMKIFSETKDADVTEIINGANEIAELAKDGITKDNAKDIMDKAEELMKKAEEAENEQLKLECIKAMCTTYSEEAAKIADEDPAETPTEEPTEAPTEETKKESIHQVIQCPETGKWCIEGDPDEQKFDTQEEAEETRARMFSDPEVRVTISGLEPASVADLLKPAGELEPKKEEEEDPAPKFNPNEGGDGRRFSMTAKPETINPLLFTEIN